MTVILNDHDRIRLAPGVRPFLRAPTIVQFGADATRTGMITTPAARELVPVLQGLARPKTLRRATEAAASVVGPDAARSLIDDLVSYRILVPVRSPAVLTVGHGELAAQVRTGLELAGLEVRAPLRGEALARFVLRQEPTLPLIAVNCAALLDDVNALASNRSGAIVPVTQVDARVFVGPVAAPGGPCPVCARHYHLDRDPNWNIVVERAPLAADTEAVSLAAGAAAAVLVARKLAGVPDPPGVGTGPVGPGHLVTVDPYGQVPVRAETLPPHPDCPSCY